MIKAGVPLWTGKNPTVVDGDGETIPHLLFEIPKIKLWLNWGFPVANVCLLLPEDVSQKHQATRDPSIQSIASWWRKFGVFITMVISGNSWGEIRRISWNLPQDIVFVGWLTRGKKAQKARAMSSYTYHSWA